MRLRRTGAMVAALTMATAALAATTSAADAGPVSRVYEGVDLGAVPDAAGCNAAPGAPRNVHFQVTGAPTGALTDVRIQRLTMTSPFIGDITAVLIAPDGTTKATIFGRTGKSTTTGSDNSSGAGPYEFSDDAAAGNWWTAAAGVGAGVAVPAGSYRTSTIGGPDVPAEAAGVQTTLTTAFAGVTNANGVWTLEFTDRCNGDIATIDRVQLGFAVSPTCVTETSAVAAAQGKLAAAQGKVATAIAGVTAATADLTTAKGALAKATKKAKAAQKALRKAKKNGSAADVASAKKALAAAKAVVRLAKGGATLAQSGLTLAQAVQTEVNARVTDAQEAVTKAQAALTGCQSS